MLTSIANKLVKFPLKRLEPRPNKAKTTAAVLVILHGDINNPQVVLTQRALHLNSHSGEVAFPGGMWDKTDSDLLQTALREAYDAGRLEKGKLVVMPAFGAGMSWGHTLLRW